MKSRPSLPALVLAFSSLASTGCVEAALRAAYATGAMKTHEEMCCQELVLKILKQGNHNTIIFKNDSIKMPLFPKTIGVKTPLNLYQSESYCLMKSWF